MEAARLFREERDYTAGLAERLSGEWWASASPVAPQATPRRPEVPEPPSWAGAATAAGSADSTAAASSPPTNDASLGHPEMCKRPCLYFASGRCSNGQACEFCHMPHARRPARLERRHREALLSLPTCVVRGTLLAVARKKLMRFDDSAETSAAFGRLEAACHKGGVEGQPEASTSHACSAQSMLDPLSLRLLLITLQRLGVSDDPEALSAADDLLKHLRAAASGRSRSL